MTIFCPHNKVNKRAKDLGFLLTLEKEGPSTKVAKNRRFQTAGITCMIQDQETKN